jgi:hypothetical protein
VLFFGMMRDYMGCSGMGQSRLHRHPQP